MPRKKSKPRIRAVVISLILSALFLTLGIISIDNLGMDVLVKKLFWPLLRLSLIHI